MLMRIDAKYMDFLHTDTCLYVLIKQVKLSKKRTFKASGFFPRKKIESKSLAEVQFLIDNCRLVSQSNYLNNFNKECDWLILACFIREQYTADATFTPLENKVWSENSANAWGNYWILYHKTNKKASTVLCSVAKHLGLRLVFYPTLLLSRFLSALQHNRAESRLLYLLNNVCLFLDNGNSTASSNIDLTEVWQVRMREVFYSCET